jgi:hypothetical protein
MELHPSKRLPQTLISIWSAGTHPTILFSFPKSQKLRTSKKSRGRVKAQNTCAVCELSAFLNL